MRCSFALWDCARSLAAANTAPSDSQLIHFVYLQSLVEEIADSFGYINEESRRLLTIGNLESIEFRVNAFKNRLEQIRVSIPPGKALSSLLLSTCRSVAVYLYEVALHIPAVSGSDSRSEQAISIQPQALSSLSNLLWECLDGEYHSFHKELVQHEKMKITHKQLRSYLGLAVVPLHAYSIHKMLRYSNL